MIAKAPVAGRSKTRLTPPCTPAQAAELAEAALVDTLTAVAASHCDRRVLVLDGEPGIWLEPFAGFEVIAQRGTGLGQRLAGAFADIGDPAFLIGMDTPQVDVADLEAGLAALNGADAALGLAPDGGYWGIGLARPVAGVFDDVPMSAGDTGAIQLDRLRRLGLRTTLLRSLRDVDTFDDAVSVARAAPGTRFAQTLSAIAAVGVAA